MPLALEQQVLNNSELVSLVFSFLKEITQREAWIRPYSLKEPPSLPAKWDAQFAHLALVNRAFFHASIEVLWEIMGSVQPFLGLILPMDKEENGKPVGPQSFYTGISCGNWERFTLYASRTKTLTLDPVDTLAIDPWWLLYLTNLKDRPDPLFPALKHLFLASNDMLSLFIALSIIPRVEFISIKLENEALDGCVGLTATMVSHCQKLSSIRLTSPMSANIINNISEIHSLTSVHLVIPVSQESGVKDLECLQDLPLLKELVLEQNLDNGDRDGINRLPSIGEAQAQASQMACLRDLVVKGSGTFQYEVAAALSPEGLTSLRLEILTDDVCNQLVFAPLTTTIYTTRNPNLTYLSVKCSDNDFTIEPDSVAEFRGNILYTKTRPLLNALSSLRNLKSLIIIIPFFATNIALEIPDLLTSLKQIETFRFVPHAMTSLPTDTMAAPGLCVMEQISSNNCCLKSLGIRMDISETPQDSLPKGYVPNNSLECLSLVFPMWHADETRVPFRAAHQYFQRLFPQLWAFVGTRRVSNLFS